MAFDHALIYHSSLWHELTIFEESKLGFFIYLPFVSVITDMIVFIFGIHIFVCKVSLLRDLNIIEGITTVIQ